MPPYQVSILHDQGTKKADVAEHPEVFDHVGLFANEPLGTAGLLLSSHPTSIHYSPSNQARQSGYIYILAIPGRLAITRMASTLGTRIVPRNTPPFHHDFFGSRCTDCGWPRSRPLLHHSAARATRQGLWTPKFAAGPANKGDRFFP